LCATVRSNGSSRASICPARRCSTFPAGSCSRVVDAHCHLDKTLYGGPWVPHSAGDALEERFANDRRRRGELGVPSVDRIAALLERMVAAGTSHVRSHTDMDPEVGLGGVEAVRAAVRRLDGRIGVEQVAFPQHGLLINPGTAELLEEALRSSVEVIGSVDPAGMDRDPVRHVDVVFDLAARYGARIDLHLHDGGSLGLWELELIVDRTRDAGLGGRVTVSHAYGFSEADRASQERLVERLAEAGVTLLTAAVYSCPVPPIKRLRAAGVNVACGHDGICDLWGPYGSGDMLERAMHVAYRSTFPSRRRHRAGARGGHLRRRPRTRARTVRACAGRTRRPVGGRGAHRGRGGRRPSDPRARAQRRSRRGPRRTPRLVRAGHPRPGRALVGDGAAADASSILSEGAQPPRCCRVGIDGTLEEQECERRVHLHVVEAEAIER
jgi:Amidohydrolase family